MFYDELIKTSHRAFTTAYTLGDNFDTVNYSDSQSVGEKQFIAVVTKGTAGGYTEIEMRNRFKKSDVLEILSPSDNFNKTFIVNEMYDEDGNEIVDAKIVQQKIRIKCEYDLREGDILRK